MPEWFKRKTPEEKAVSKVSQLYKEIQKLQRELKQIESQEEPTGFASGLAKIGIEAKKTGLQKKIDSLEKEYNEKFAELTPEKQLEVSRNQAPVATEIAPSSQREERSDPSEETHTPPPMQPEAHEVPSQGQGWAEWAWESTKVYITQGSFIYDTVKTFYQNSPEEEVQRKLEGADTLPPEEVRRINKALRDEIEKMSKVEPKKDESKKELVYEIDGDKLTQKTGDNGKYDFEPSANFTGTLSVNRTDPSTGKILDDQVDIIHFENGKVVSLIPAEHGERMFNSLGAEVERKAKELGSPSGMGVKVAATRAEDQSQGVGEVLIQSQQEVGHVYTPTTRPVAPGSPSQHKRGAGVPRP